MIDRSRWTAAFALSLLFTVGACPDDGEDDPADSEGDATGGTEAGSTGATDEPGSTGPGGDPGSTGDDGATTGGEAGTTTGGSTGEGGGTTSGGAACEEDIPPNVGDMEGTPCCTMEESCNGGAVESGETPQDSDLGDLLHCIDGVWTVTEGECPVSCMDDHGPDAYYAGCFWRTSDGDPVYPQCGCKR